MIYLFPISAVGGLKGPTNLTPIFEMGPTEEWADVASELVPSVVPTVGTSHIADRTRGHLFSLLATITHFAILSLPWNPRRSDHRLFPGGPLGEWFFSRNVELVGAIFRPSLCGRGCRKRDKSCGFKLPIVSAHQVACGRGADRY